MDLFAVVVEHVYLKIRLLAVASHIFQITKVKLHKWAEFFFLFFSFGWGKKSLSREAACNLTRVTWRKPIGAARWGVHLLYELIFSTGERIFVQKYQKTHVQVAAKILIVVDKILNEREGEGTSIWSTLNETDAAD